MKIYAISDIHGYIEEFNTALSYIDLDDEKYIKWMRSLELFYMTDKQIYVHAGVDEEADDLWKYGTSEEMFCEKYPPTTGEFYMDIIAGHIGTAMVSGDPDFHGIFHDGKSHYYIDGTVSISGRIPVLMYDTESGKYSRLNS
ncbi:hypothetical protein [Butyrivibrio sp. WCD2001]|uniref:hypothetical protein n=1 Tax=Butyrivibrio sp. WCD2001 TaxID=1280681 RepID=UPI0003FC9A9E|nr:hypothetical protein [Butyrivibrio sp. WCD2001]